MNICLLYCHKLYFIVGSLKFGVTLAPVLVVRLVALLQLADERWRLPAVVPKLGASLLPLIPHHFQLHRDTMVASGNDSFTHLYAGLSVPTRIWCHRPPSDPHCPSLCGPHGGPVVSTCAFTGTSIWVACVMGWQHRLGPHYT